MTSKNRTSQLTTHSVLNTNKEINEIESDLYTDKDVNGIESNPEFNGMNIDGSINLNTGESTSWTVVDESVKLDTGEGTKEVYGVEVSPEKVNSESTTSTDRARASWGEIGL
jgi:hypothetical protein